MNRTMRSHGIQTTAILAGIAVASPNAAAARDWMFTQIDGGVTPDATGSPIALVLDDQQHPHIAYTAAFTLPHDYEYAYYDGEQWHVEVIDAWPFAYGTFFADIAIALDATGRPHVAYTKVFSPDGELLYALRDENAGWQITSVTTTDHAMYCSLALDSQDQPRIAFYRSSLDGGLGRDLLYAHFDEDQWQIDEVDTLGWVGYYASLVLDSADHPHIAYRHGTEHYVKYAHHDGAKWHITTVHDPADAIGYGISIALDSQDRPHIAYTANLFSKSLWYSHYDGATWVHTAIADAGRASSTAIAVNAQDRPHIVYDYAWSDEAGPHDHRYIFLGDEGWHDTLIEAGAGYGMDHDIALDACDRPHLAFGRRTSLYNGWLVYAEPEDPCPPVGDITGDGVVDTLDLLALLADWGPCPDPPADCPADLDGDGVVDVLDLLILLGSWTD